MAIRNTADRYGAGPAAIHWLTFILVIAVWIGGQVAERLGNSPQKGLVMFIHISGGLLILGLLVLRLLWRVLNPAPALEATPLGKIGILGAKVGHLAIYLLLLCVPIGGILTVFARGRDLPIFGLTKISPLITPDKALAEQLVHMHGLFANILLFLALAHAVVALFHHFVLKDNTLKRMMPGRA